VGNSRRRFLLRAAALGGVALAQPSRELHATGASPERQTATRQPGAPPPREVAPLTPAEEVLARKRNWGRWGNDDPKGAVNLITPQKRIEAARLVKSGRSVPLSRPFTPEQQFIQVNQQGTGGSVVDYYGFMYHGISTTHVDALCHVWDRHGMWNGRDPAKEIDSRGTHFADITAFSEGLITRGVLLDVPRHRKEPFVALEKPVTGSELEAIARAQRVQVEPGDALLIYCGREAFTAAGHVYPTAPAPRPGLDVSCAAFVREHDVSVLAWDMHDALPDPHALPWPGHGVIFSFGVALVDNAYLESLAAVCADERRYEFMFMALPLRIPRGTGSPANPIALL
jgi:kynurenine formamidase